MKLTIINKKQKTVLELFESLKEINSELLSIDTEISFLNDKSDNIEVIDLREASLKLRSERDRILFKISRLAE